MKELVQYLAKSLVNNPDAVEVRETEGDTASVVELKVAKEDLKSSDLLFSSEQQRERYEPNYDCKQYRNPNAQDSHRIIDWLRNLWSCCLRHRVYCERGF